MRSPLILVLVFFLLAGNLAWATDVDVPPPAQAAVLDDGDHAPAEHAGGSCNHWCHGSAHLLALPSLHPPLLPRHPARNRPPAGTLPTTLGDAPPTPPPIA